VGERKKNEKWNSGWDGLILHRKGGRGKVDLHSSQDPPKEEKGKKRMVIFGIREKGEKGHMTVSPEMRKKRASLVNIQREREKGESRCFGKREGKEQNVLFLDLHGGEKGTVFIRDLQNSLQAYERGEQMAFFFHPTFPSMGRKGRKRKEGIEAVTFHPGGKKEKKKEGGGKDRDFSRRKRKVTASMTARTARRFGKKGLKRKITPICKRACQKKKKRGGLRLALRSERKGGGESYTGHLCFPAFVGGRGKESALLGKRKKTGSRPSCSAQDAILSAEKGGEGCSSEILSLI